MMLVLNPLLPLNGSKQNKLAQEQLVQMNVAANPLFLYESF